MRRGTLVFAACIAAITAVAVIVLVARDAPRAPAPRPGASTARTVPPEVGERQARRTAERPATERQYGHRGDRRYERSPTTRRSELRTRIARREDESDRMRREALRRHAERMRADEQLHPAAGPDCEVPDAFDVPGCAPP